MITRTSLLQELMDRRASDMPVEMARWILDMSFSAATLAQYEALSAKAQDGSMSEAERAQLEDLLWANNYLGTLKSRARQSLNRTQNPAA